MNNTIAHHWSTAESSYYGNASKYNDGTPTQDGNIDHMHCVHAGDSLRMTMYYLSNLDSLIDANATENRLGLYLPSEERQNLADFRSVDEFVYHQMGTDNRISTNDDQDQDCSFFQYTGALVCLLNL